MRVMIWGGGALGLLWTHRLRQWGAEPVLVVRRMQQRECIRQEGILLTDRQGGVHRGRVDVYTMEEKLPAVDWVWVMVKQTALDAVLDRLDSILNSRTEVWLWQNGWHPRWPLSGGAGAWWNVVTTEGALKINENQVQHTGEGLIWVGSLLAQPKKWPELERLPGLEQAIEYDDRIRDRIWTKLALNCVINPLTAIWRVPNGKLPAHKEFPLLAEGLIKEATAAAQIEGVKLSVAALSRQVRAVCKRTAANRSSMLQDVETGRITEIDYINGAIVRTGEKAGVEFPFNREMVKRVQHLTPF
ncbi:ketopantoate reductase family protein [Desmospora activa]|uniref:2-dehydropantoate 2-reductase n=1 Tax=Desmospora activa DSM 45169 TaxID=1121389 RepID=A0A2T4ZBI3_9BACL|nr:2-dehydropantoate 2-reductase [Desmospora activa]PTM59235.1 2-dehydropantoate 2-reductase [Desmospora activa DSM 45169]